MRLCFASQTTGQHHITNLLLNWMDGVRSGCSCYHFHSGFWTRRDYVPCFSPNPFIPSLYISVSVCIVLSVVLRRSEPFYSGFMHYLVVKYVLKIILENKLYHFVISYHPRLVE